MDKKQKSNKSKDNNNKSTIISSKGKASFPPIDKKKMNNTNSNLKQKSKESSNSLNFLPNINKTQTISPNLNFENHETSENIKVCLRIRPMNLQEQGRNDLNCIEPVSSNQLIFTNKNMRRSYTYNLVFGPDTTQEDIFYNCSVNKLIDSALEGYSVTIFAYGQTGSGKTYTIMGRDDSINEKILSNDKYSGIMPKSINYIWNTVGSKQEKYYIKVSFLEIYNEQINDLLNIGNTNLQIRWDQRQGFFVEGLLVIECKKPEDIVEVILQGTKNRKKGSHELNKDSSRSHTILTVYVISEFTNQGQNFKKYGKISFVDLAGSERLKETHSSGGMIKETGNINKSLFVLGKVISSLTDKKNNNQHIPYRDSKLTMLLMDSIGGSSKTLMIACVSPSATYSDETMSTLNYASRTMNIKNRPLVQMEGKDMPVARLKRQNNVYKLENEFLKNEFIKLLGQVPDIQSGGLTEQDIEMFKVSQGIISDEVKNEELRQLTEENEDLRKMKDRNERQKMNLNNENMILNAKLTNLENIYIGSDIIRHSDGSVSNNIDTNYNLSAVLLENKELKKTIDKLELDKLQLKDIAMKIEEQDKDHSENIEFENMKEQNAKLSRKIEFLQKRESELLDTIMKLKNQKK
jgi:hypothetical protein